METITEHPAEYAGQLQEVHCDCGAVVWCYLHGYVIEPREYVFSVPETSPVTIPKPIIPTTGHRPVRSDGGPFGITLADLRAWKYDVLCDLAQRMRPTYLRLSDERVERFVKRLYELLPKATSAAIVYDAWDFSLQPVENTSDEIENTPVKKGSKPKGRKVTPQVNTDRIRRSRAGRRGFSPEKLTPYQAVRAHQRSGRKSCFVCGTLINTGPHHIIPRSEGGLPTTDNIVWLCEPHHNEIEGPYAGVWERLRLAKATRDN